MYLNNCSLTYLKYKFSFLYIFILINQAKRHFYRNSPQCIIIIYFIVLNIVYHTSLKYNIHAFRLNKIHYSTKFYRNYKHLFSLFILILLLLLLCLTLFAYMRHLYLQNLQYSYHLLAMPLFFLKVNLTNHIF